MRIFLRLLPYIRPHLGRMALALVAMALTGSLAAGAMWILKSAVDLALAGREKAVLLDCVVVLITVYVLNAILTYTHVYMTNRAGQSAIRELRNDVFAHLQSLSMNYFTANASARITSRLTNDMWTFQYLVTGALTTLTKDGFMVVSLAAFLFHLHWRFAFLSLAILPVTILLLVRFGRKSRRAGRDGQSKMSDLYLLLQETLTAMPVVKAFQREPQQRERFREENRRFFDICMRLVRAEALSSPVMELVAVSGIALLLWAGGQDVIAGKWTVGAFVAFVGSALTMYKPLKNVARMNVQVQQAIAAGERIFELLDERPAVEERPGARALPALARDIRFERVGFSYRPGEPVLEDIELSIGRGEVVAFVGSSGSGKTTLVHLLLRFYDPTSGAIRVDGHDLREVTLGSLRRQIGIVTQDTHLFNDTVFANIAFGAPEAPARAVEEAARIANADGFIRKLPAGYETVIGERGVLLSGGEKQRLAIARAVLKNPPILILDEATSALDAVSEAQVQEALERVLAGRTVLMVAHRLATVRRADRIVVLKKGRIVQAGTQEELLKKGGAYQELYELQFQK